MCAVIRMVALRSGRERARASESMEMMEWACTDEGSEPLACACRGCGGDGLRHGGRGGGQLERRATCAAHDGGRQRRSRGLGIGVPASSKRASNGPWPRAEHAWETTPGMRFMVQESALLEPRTLDYRIASSSCAHAYVHAPPEAMRAVSDGLFGLGAGRMMDHRRPVVVS